MIEVWSEIFLDVADAQMMVWRDPSAFNFLCNQISTLVREMHLQKILSRIIVQSALLDLGGRSVGFFHFIWAQLGQYWGISMAWSSTE